MGSSLMRTLIEIPLWILANILCSIIPTAIAYQFGTQVLGWTQVQAGFYLTVMVIATMTWGSWAALIWSRSRAVRVGLRASTVLPGIVTSAIGVLGLWTGFGAVFAWALVIAAGIGTSVAAVLLSKKLGVRPSTFAAKNVLAGLVAFPFVTTMIAGVIGSVWYHFITHPVDGNWRSLVSFATVMVTVMAVALISTVIPALTSSFAQRATAKLR